MGYRNDLGLITCPMLGGVERLWREVGESGLLVNGQLVEPTFWLDGTGLDDSAKTWTCRKTGTVLSEAGSGSSPDLTARAPALGERGAEFEAAKRLQGPNNTFGDLTTEDYVTLVVFRFGSVGILAAKRLNGVGNGQLLYRSGATLASYLNAGAGVQAVTANLTEGDWYIGTCFHHRPGSAQWYINGAASGAAAAISGDSGSLTVASPLCLGSYDTGGVAGDHTVALYAQYKGAAWLNSHLQPTVARELASLYFGKTALHNHAALCPSTL
jgi:hypothetical protein